MRLGVNLFQLHPSYMPQPFEVGAFFVLFPLNTPCYLPTMQPIPLKRVLSLMEHTDHKGKPVPFDLVTYTADRHRRTGGERLELKGATLTWHNKKLPRQARELRKHPGKSPSHWKNATRNILLPNGQIRKVHIRLIVRFDGKVVIY